MSREADSAMIVEQNPDHESSTSEQTRPKSQPGVGKVEC